MALAAVPMAGLDHPMVTSFLASVAVDTSVDASTGRLHYERLLAQAASPSDYIELSRTAARAYQAALSLESGRDVAAILNLLSFAVRSFPGVNNDASHVISAEILRRTRDWCIENGFGTDAAITARNRATVVLEKVHVTDGELSGAQVDLEVSKKQVQPGTEDEAYHSYAAALYEFRLHQNHPGTSTALARVLQRMAQTARVNRKRFTMDQRLGAAAQLARVEAEVFDTIVREDEAALVASHSEDLRELEEGLDLKGADLASFIRANPPAIGLEDRPEWLPEIPDWGSARGRRRRHARKLINSLAERIQVSKGRVGSVSMDFARKALAELRWRHHTSAETYRGLIDSLGDPGSVDHLDQYFSSIIMTFERGKAILSLNPTVDDLRCARNAYLRLVGEATPEELKYIALMQANRARFLSCEFAEEGLYEEAFDLLEASRDLRSAALHSGTAPTGAGIASIHVTHNPDATYVIGRIDSRFAGCSIPQLAGRELVRYWLSFDPGQPGASILAVIAGGAQFNAALERMHSVFDPLVSEVVRLADSRPDLRLSLGGFYTRLPLAALIEEMHPGSFEMISVSRRAGKSAVGIGRAVTTGTVLCAGHTPGHELKYAHVECQMISQLMTGAGYSVQIVEDPTTVQALQALAGSDVVHYSGHSSASVLDPNESCLELSDGVLSVREIDRNQRSAQLITLSSCESGLVQSAASEDEFLSLGTSVISESGGVSVSSYWGVYDVASFFFFINFYGVLFSSGTIGEKAVYASLAETQRHLRTATVRELAGEIAAATGDSVGLPLAMQSQDDDSNPFALVRNWGAYFMTIR